MKKALVHAIPRDRSMHAVAQLSSEKAVAEAYAGELKTALEEAYEYIEQLEEERWGAMRNLDLLDYMTCDRFILLLGPRDGRLHF